MKTPIDIKIPKSLPQHPWHPSVVYSEEGWNGHRWWMAETPYPPFDVKPYKDRWELPCIHYSDDGLHWKNAGAPIDNLTDEQITSHSYHSDPHLVLKKGVLYCYYRLMEEYDAKTTIIRKRSTDGSHWSEREIIQISNDPCRSSNSEIISPAIVWTGEKWRMYYVDDTFTNLERRIQMAESKDGVCFEHVRSVWELQEVIPWHIDVQLIDDMYYLLVHDVDHRTLTLYDSKDGVIWGNKWDLLKASGRWIDYWSRRLYRACIVNANIRKLIYFSATDGMASYIGLMSENQQGKFEIADVLVGKKKTIFAMVFMSRRIKQFILRVVQFIRKRIR